MLMTGNFPIGRRTEPSPGRLRLWAIVAPLAVGMLLLGACGAGATKAQKVTLQLPWIMTGFYAAYALAESKGYYRNAGFDVTVRPGRGDAVAVERLGKGSTLFADAEIGGVAPLLSKGLADRVLAVWVQKGPFSFIYHAGTKLNTPRDLAGHTIITSPTSSMHLLLPAVLAKYGISESSLHFDFVQGNLEVPTFLKHKHAILLGFSNQTYLAVKKIDPSANDKLFADFGIEVYSDGLLTTNAEIKAHPGQVKRFVAATQKGWQEAMSHPAEAAAAAKKLFPNVNAKLLAEEAKQTVPLLHTQASKGHPLGWMAPADWRSTLDILHSYGGMKQIKPIADYYTNRFVPS